MAFKVSEQEQTGPNLLPPGTYTVDISKAEIKASKNDSSCHMIACEFTTEAGRKLFQNFIFEHGDEDVKKFNLARLADCLFAVNAPDELESVEDSIIHLQAATLKVKVGVGPNKQRGTDENKIYEYYNMNNEKRGGGKAKSESAKAVSKTKPQDVENDLPF